MMTAVAQEVENKSRNKRFITLEKFLERYTNREDSFKYEWNNGTIEKKDRTMNRDQTKILQKLMRLFAKTKAYQSGGELINEVDMF
jgi:signal transduction histidine kinase